MAEEVGFEPTVRLAADNGFQDEGGKATNFYQMLTTTVT